MKFNLEMNSTRFEAGATRFEAGVKKIEDSAFKTLRKIIKEKRKIWKSFLCEFPFLKKLERYALIEEINVYKYPKQPIKLIVTFLPKSKARTRREE